MYTDSDTGVWHFAQLGSAELSNLNHVDACISVYSLQWYVPHSLHQESGPPNLKTTTNEELCLEWAHMT